MARITVEDCLDHVDNRFDLVLMAAQRARQLSYGTPSKVDPENDKPTVVALREIAEGLVDSESVDADAESNRDAIDELALLTDSFGE